MWDRIDQPFPSVVVAKTLPAKEARRLSQRQENMALWLVMSLATTGVYVVPTLLIEEKRSRTLNAVLATPASYGAVLLAKAGVGFVYGLLSSGLILILNGGLGASPGPVIGTVFLGALVLVEIGLLLGSLFDDMAALNTWGTLAVLVLMLPGMLYGFIASDLFRLRVLQGVLRLLPTHYFLELVFAALSDRAGLGLVVADMVPLVGLALFLFLLAIVTLRRREN